MSFAIVLAGVFVAYRLFNLEPRKDQDGNRPEDLARIFIDAVQVGDFEKAAACWRAGDVRNIEANADMTFEEFCTHFFGCDTYEVSSMGKDKNSRVVAFRGQKGGSSKTFGLFLQRIDGRWRLLMNRFMPDSEEHGWLKDAYHVITA